MKNLIACATILLTLTTNANSSVATDLFVYQCGAKTVVVKNDGDKYAIKMAFLSETTKNHKINIASEIATIDQLKQVFSEDQTVDENGYQQSTGLPQGSLAFTGFHYSKGDMYVTAEGETNEEGFTFAIESEALKGQATVKATDIFWSDFSDLQVVSYSCSRIK